MSVDDRLARLEDRTGRVEQQLVETRSDVKEARADIHEILVTIQGPPREESLRGRLHRVEDNQSAAKAAEAALTAAKSFYERSSEKRFSKWEKLAGLLIAFALLLSNWLAPLLVHNHPHP